MLLMSVHDEAELENKRARYGGCKWSAEQQHPPRTADDISTGLPSLMALLLRTRMQNKSAMEPLCLKESEIADIESVSKISRREIMLLLLNFASIVAEIYGENSASSAIVEGESGGFYIGIPVAWKGKGIRFIAHGLQAAIMNAWHQGEKKIRSVITLTPPCACCRQFLREVWMWNKVTVYCAEDGLKAFKTGKIKEGILNQSGLQLESVKTKLLNEAKRSLKIAKSQNNELLNVALDAADWSYAPYSRNNAGVAVKTKFGLIYPGRCIEVRDSVTGFLAIESALINLVLSGELISNVSEIFLVEARGTITQFSATQKMAQAIGNIPFRFMMTM
jgi:cytidine deaminase